MNKPLFKYDILTSDLQWKRAHFIDIFMNIIPKTINLKQLLIDNI